MAEIKTSFRFTFDPCHYFLPLLLNQDVQKEISHLAWHSQNGPSWNDAEWKVSLDYICRSGHYAQDNPPFGYVSGKSGSPSNGDDAPASLSKQIRNSNLPGSHSETDNITQGQGCQWIT
ncbi:hypothetical protein CF326_g3418 [Tilletia indica]|nr:hypothetical protein CF326_g3418 [Tilletia indica]